MISSRWQITGQTLVIPKWDSPAIFLLSDPIWMVVSEELQHGKSVITCGMYDCEAKRYSSSTSKEVGGM